MPKVPTGMADISTERRILPEGLYPGKITKVVVGKSKNGKDMVTITTEVKAADDPFGLDIDDNFVLETKEGERNEAGLRGLKKLTETLLGEDRAADPDFDTDELVNVQCQVLVVQDSFEDKHTKEIIPTNKIKRYLAA